jgi:hypothetical protein
MASFNPAHARLRVSDELHNGIIGNYAYTARRKSHSREAHQNSNARTSLIEKLYSHDYKNQFKDKRKV